MRKYLIVDDNQAFAENLAEILSDDGAEVDVAANGEAAIHRICNQRYDVLLSDMKMPVMSGAELVQRIRALDPDLPAIVITAYTNDEDLRSARREGVLAILPKPVPLPELIRLVSTAKRGTLVALSTHDRAHDPDR
jgi:two-component system, response regulator PdtaR